MKLAFVDNLSVYGGLSRFSLLLCKSLVETEPGLTIDYYSHINNLRHAPELKEIPGIKIHVLQSTMLPGLPTRILRKLNRKFTRTEQDIENKVISEIEEKINGQYDVAYFPAAHMMKRPDLKIPMVGTLHDFNWKYFFGRQIFSLEFVEMMDKEILNWMDNGVNVCSSHDVVDEAKKLYPGAKRYPNVVHIAPVIYNADIPEARKQEILKDLKIDFPYIIFPGNFFPHKNHLNLLTAFSMLKKRQGFGEYKLLLTGMNSNQVPRGIAEKRGVQMLTKNSVPHENDVWGMGYQPNEVIDTLISKARLLVSPSIYEAICTPAMDAWHFGTPTAISDIPPFREHERVWGIRSAFFDPLDPVDIANTIENYLNQYDEAKLDGLISKENVSKHNWGTVAGNYMQNFKKAISERK
ncbi:MAG: hypothetical protein C5B59_14965 [Bacteroidetes bacterium]|nr:MAG: hypothetical protein C5B59_14965 [Bacteroidota bacterium]